MKVRFLVYALILAILPLVGIAYCFAQKRASWQQVEAMIQKVQLSLDSKQTRQAVNSLLRKELQECDKSFFSKLTSLSFLEKERRALEQLFASRSFTGNEAAEKRYNQIVSENHIKWAEGKGQDFEDISECEISLLHSIEVDTQDLKRIVNLIEEHSLGPQLFFTDWMVTRKETGLGSEVYELNFKLLKREFHS